MKIGDLVTATWLGAFEGPPSEQPVGIVTRFDPEDIQDMDEVEVVWTYKWQGASNHSTCNLGMISESR
jgi:hypothetical protein